MKIFHRELEDLNIDPEVVDRLLNLNEDPKGMVIRMPLQQTPFPTRTYAEDKAAHGAINETMFELAGLIGKQRLAAMYEKRPAHSKVQ